MTSWLRRPKQAAAEPAAPAPRPVPAVRFSDLFAPSPPLPPDDVALPEMWPDSGQEPPNLSGIRRMAPASTAAPESAEPSAPYTADATLRAWAMEELSPFLLAPVSMAEAEAFWAQINATSRTIFIFRIAGGMVAIAEKSPHLIDGVNSLTRAHHYLTFFETLLPLLPEWFEATFAFDTNDVLTTTANVPVFCFQKRRGGAGVLMPDIDFLVHDFYLDPTLQDRLPYERKMQRAIFVGSTSGATVTPDIARQNALPRLRAAKFFIGNPRVDFLLPAIVQTSNEEARAILETMPFCQDGPKPWQEQLLCRLLLSMDGNGATCSRVAIALRSNSVLLKYESEDRLFYFRGLQPWLHYVPITRDEDVDAVLDMEARDPDLFASIAEAGRDFALATLTRDAVSRYAAQILTLYPGCFTTAATTAKTATGTASSAPDAKPKPALSGNEFYLLGHVQNTGDSLANAEHWVGTPGSGLCVEGFLLSLADADVRQKVLCRSVLADGSFGDAVRAGSYCGTRNRNLPIHGFVIEAAPDAGDLPPIVYEGAFVDGTSSGVLPLGAVCKAASGVAMEAMRVVVG